MLVRQIDDYVYLQSRSFCIAIDIPAQSSSQPEIVEHRWPQINREIADQTQRFIDGVDIVLDVTTYFRGFGNLVHSMKIHLDRGQNLADLVVQLACDSTSLIFLSLD